jgi:hypothetical protein
VDRSTKKLSGVVGSFLQTGRSVVDIHANAKKRLIEEVAKVIPRFEVKNARYITRVPAFMALREGGGSATYEREATGSN